jgi:GH24 family phage-related lysozyme (muramidase)
LTNLRPTKQPATASSPLARLARSAKPRQPGSNQDSATPLANNLAAIERMRREAAALKAPKVTNDLVQRFKQHMIPKEHDRNDVYPDNLGIPTVGIGHKVLPSDNLKLGDVITNARKEAFWRQDSAKALQAAQQQMKEAGINDPDFFIALADVNFQLGRGWRADFKKTWALILAGDYEIAAREVRNSKWFKQTPDRVEAFRKALLALSIKRAQKKQ